MSTKLDDLRDYAWVRALVDGEFIDPSDADELEVLHEAVEAFADQNSDLERGFRVAVNHMRGIATDPGP